ncbi:MAG: hypothetical protein ACMG6S_27935 [Byssovorax sp.]
MRTTHGLTTAALGILAALAAFVGCKSSAGNATAEGGGDQRAVAGAQRLPACNLVCTTAQDCGVAAGLEDASHFQCTAGRCQWQGCKSNAECTQAFQSENFICAQEGGAPVPTCIRACTAAADCAGQTASDDASHYACTGGRCEWLGCKSSAECNAAFQSDKFVCVKEGGAPVPGCVLECNAPTDCVGPAAAGGPDASRFTCTDHRCAWLGCESTEECKKLYHNQAVVCE